MRCSTRGHADAHSDVAYAREALRFFDRDLGRPVVEGTHDASCELTATNLYNALDHYALAHALGWFGKALILRDWWLLLILSVRRTRHTLADQSRFLSRRAR